MHGLDILLKRIPGVDYDSAVKRMSDNAAFYAELLRLFFKDDPLKNIAAAFEIGDNEKAIYEAHSIKGTAANLGLVEIAQLAADIHLSLKRGDETQAKTMFDELDRACRGVRGIIFQLDGGKTDESA